jgi:hypothetical protein
MDALDTLQTLADIGLGIAGFSGIVAVFIRKAGGDGELAAFRVANLLVFSFSGLFLAVAPTGLALSGIEDESLWRVSSGVFVIVSLMMVWDATRRRDRLSSDSREIILRHVWYMRLNYWPSLACMGVAMLNCAGWPADPSPAVYFWCVLWILSLAAITFARTVFGPRHSNELSNLVVD